MGSIMSTDKHYQLNQVLTGMVHKFNTIRIGNKRFDNQIKRFNRK